MAKLPPRRGSWAAVHAALLEGIHRPRGVVSFASLGSDVTRRVRRALLGEVVAWLCACLLLRLCTPPFANGQRRMQAEKKGLTTGADVPLVGWARSVREP